MLYLMWNNTHIKNYPINLSSSVLPINKMIHDILFRTCLDGAWTKAMKWYMALNISLPFCNVKLNWLAEKWNGPWTS